MKITVDVSELHRLRKQLANIPNDDAALAKVAAELGKQSLTQTDRRFDRRETPERRPWAARKVATDNPILERSGALRRSPEVRDADNTGVTLASALPYSAVHQWGGGGKRQFLGWGVDDLDELAETAEAELTGFVGETLGSSGFFGEKME